MKTCRPMRYRPSAPRTRVVRTTPFFEAVTTACRACFFAITTPVKLAAPAVAGRTTAIAAIPAAASNRALFMGGCLLVTAEPAKGCPRPARRIGSLGDGRAATALLLERWHRPESAESCGNSPVGGTALEGSWGYSARVKYWKTAKAVISRIFTSCQSDQFSM